MKYWIDICNSPHVLFFEPVIKELEKQGHSVIVTARDFASTVSLLDKKQIPYKLIGKHGGKYRLMKAFSLVTRELRLFAYLINIKIDKALGHASYDSALVSKLLRVPSVTTFDYEYADTIHKVLLKYVNSCIIPVYIPRESLTRFGIKKENIHYFHGLKELVYLKNFQPQRRFVTDLLDEKKINIVIRPPADMSEYYRDVKQHLVYEICDYLHEKMQETCHVVLTPRTEEQGAWFKKKYSDFLIMDKAFDGPQLMYWSDYVLSAGGTMIREAAALGTQAISISDLKLGAVDKHLVSTGKLIYIKNLNDFVELELKKRDKDNTCIDDSVFNEYMDYITKN
jgi:predicted glycosyltransferase